MAVKNITASDHRKRKKSSGVKTGSAKMKKDRRTVSERWVHDLSDVWLMHLFKLKVKP